ncbi:MAG TPA: DUF5677 domain-containing protein [Candidatus Wunengus californicus]|uniref:DUF5677 domain-containing protein n=1 Tax=Candidatus Wunengus californicus TaxID=3367619 RepID=UPI004028A11B
MSEKLDYSQIEQLIRTFIEQARLELKERWKKWIIDLSQSELHEVVGALLARQVTLARQMAVCPPIWNGHIAPIILRAMADVYISLVWILKDPVDRSRNFVLYGLGQAKLQLEHRKAQIGDREPTPEEKLMIEASQAWINSQRFTFLTEVNVGSWSGISTCKMAEEADCIDFYNYVYNPFSACTHSMWHHIARYNLRQCANPIHQYHQVPEDPELPIDPYNLYLAAEYLQKSFSAFDKKFAIQVDVPSAYEHLCEGLDKLSDTKGVEPDKPNFNSTNAEDV